MPIGFVFLISKKHILHIYLYRPFLLCFQSYKKQQVALKCEKAKKILGMNGVNDSAAIRLTFRNYRV